MDDFLNAFHEVIPAFGASTDDLERCRVNGIVDCGQRHDHIFKRTMLLVEQVKISRGSPLVTVLLEGPSVVRLQWQLLLALVAIFPM
ncbi:hypothetical protein L1987_23489 [Smallanthus sonchifolius]|uniref:Uncharacterized protein n=1 Tax=Smallanthus sonchifolius TaxID=185202 RepID=A0ACB9II20_9ASTR|nr:hypothetical protein L1987_23489 [Smallanthus sonchifolius]